MCVVSMVMDHTYDEWLKRYWPPPMPVIPYPFPVPANPVPPVQAPTKKEVDEFRRLLERAREYDRKNNEPDCELEEKRKKLRDLAKDLGVDISFV